MRWIQKGIAPPSLSAFLQAQIPIGLNLDFEDGFPGKRTLRQELMAEQFGLCGYTGVAIDDRLGQALVNPQGPVRFRAHIEHLKPQSICRKELIDLGKLPGRDLGEDMDHNNMVAALCVEGSERELFGAAAKKGMQIPVWPTHQNCESKFQYDRNGGIFGLDNDADTTLQVLKLEHATLVGWRRAALDTFLGDITTRQGLVDLIARLDQPQNGELVEFSFCIKNVAASMLTP